MASEYASRAVAVRADSDGDRPGPQDFARVERSLRAFLRSKGLSPSDADDVLQEAMIRVLGGLDQLRAPAAFDAFVFRTTRFALADHFRRGPRDRPGDTTPDDLQIADEQESWDDIETDQARLALSLWLRGEIEQLPEPIRTTLRRTELEGWRLREVAEAERVSLSAIKSRVSRGRKLLKARLHACCAVQLDARRRITSYTKREDDLCDCGTGTCGER